MIDQLEFLNRNFLQGNSSRTLIILDACRHDYFKTVYKEYLQGRLQRTWSPACHTYEWVRKTLTGHYPEITIISAHPVFNSKGVEVHGFKALGRFHRIIDVWNFGYEDHLGTVKPCRVADAIRELTPYHEKLLIWFLQPHCPYIGKTKIARYNPHARGNLDLDSRHWIEQQLKSGQIKMDMLKQAYYDNLITALEAIKSLAGHLQEDVIITSDHGELLGEDGKYFHPSQESENPILRTVPLFQGRIQR